MTTYDVETSAATAERAPARVGNWLVLIGAVLYLCEFVGIGFASVSHVPAKPGTAAAEILHRYAGHAAGVGFLVGWLALVQLGRVLVVVGIRDALRRSGRGSSWLDLAVVAMALGVAFEVAGEALAAGAAALAGGGNDGAVLALDRGAWYLQSALLAPTGVAIIVAVGVMWRSQLFPIGLNIVGALAGVLVLAGGVLTSPDQVSLQDTMTTGVLLLWAWMLWTGILLIRRT